MEKDMFANGQTNNACEEMCSRMDDHAKMFLQMDDHAKMYS